MATNYLKQIRKSKKITQKELAKMIGVASRTILLFEKGHNFHKKTLEKILKALDVSEEYLMTGRDKNHDLKPPEFDKKIMQTSIKLTRDFFEIYQFQEEFIDQISSELYVVLKKYEDAKNHGFEEVFLKDSLENYLKGLAVKCFLETFKPDYIPYDKKEH